MRKGIQRGLMLIAIGYSLRMPLFDWLIGVFKNSFLVIDVLQCIGVSLILIVLIFRITCKKLLLFSMVMLLLGLGIFLSEPLYRYLELPNIPVVFANYLTRTNGSIFNIIPWFGYVAFGAFISTLFYSYVERPRFKIAIVSSFSIIGVLLITKSAWLLIRIYRLTDLELIKEVAYYNYLFTRFGNVLILFALFYAAEKYLKQPIVLKIGQKTLSIYVIHFIIIYGSYTGIGLHQILGKTLVPWQAIIGALVFLTAVCFISFYYVKTNEFIYSRIIKFIRKVKKYTR